MKEPESEEMREGRQWNGRVERAVTQKFRGVGLVEVEFFELFSEFEVLRDSKRRRGEKPKRLRRPTPQLSK